MSDTEPDDDLVSDADVGKASPSRVRRRSPASRQRRSAEEVARNRLDDASVSRYTQVVTLTSVGVQMRASAPAAFDARLATQVAADARANGAVPKGRVVLIGQSERDLTFACEVA